jgi:hypothetical protein
MKHTDERRTIYDFAQGIFKSLKVVYTHEELNIGDHLHHEKDECFFLAVGKFLELQLGEEISYNVEAPFFFHVERGTYHRFLCEKGSVIFGGATALFDEKDEIKIK